MNKETRLSLFKTDGLYTELFFENESDKLSLNDFADYLRYLKALYAYLEKRPELIKDLSGQTIGEICEQKEIIEKRISTHFGKNANSGFTLSPNYQRYLGEYDLYIGEIKKESPLTITITGIGIVLVVAVIISGGEIDLPGVRFRINALGDGLKKLKDLFHKDVKTTKYKK